VEDIVVTGKNGRKDVKGTKVSADVLSVDQDTLFPCRLTSGTRVTQSLFVGKDTLLVEGPSDVLSYR
jgi:hypothetical protein